MYYEVLPSTTKYYKVLQSITKYYKSTTKYYKVLQGPRGRLGGPPETVMCKICAVLCARAFPAQAGSRRPPLGRKEGRSIFPNFRSRNSQIMCKVMCDCYVPSLCAKVMCKRIVFETNCFLKRIDYELGV